MSTGMAALVKLGNSAGKRGVNALFRLKYFNVVERSVSTCRARLLVGSRRTINDLCSPLYRWDRDWHMTLKCMLPFPSRENAIFVTSHTSMQLVLWLL